MKIYRTFKELKEAPEEIREFFMEMESNEPPVDEMEFLDYYGGDVHLVETIDDIKEIPSSIADDSETRWLSLYETASVFDSCRYIKNGKFVEVFLVTTNAGGHTYFIPKEIAEACPNVAESIRQSKGESG